MSCQDKRFRSHRTDTIHGCAQSGDLVLFQKLLQDNPSLLNERSPTIAQTPLHVAAGNNKFGETPLHMAAKNGNSETARLLLAHGAFIECKANNGMTPLHLAVWTSIGTQDCSTVKILLEYNADCNAKDNEGMTPLDHFSKLQGPGNMELDELLQYHIGEQMKKKALEACTHSQAKMEELECELSGIVGLHDLKIQLRKWAKGALLDERRRALGLRVGRRKPPHMAFLGNPGTGKTMVGRILARLLHLVGMLPTDKVTEVQRTDLVGEFVGHTGPKTQRKIRAAEGGVLFVDEAYRLVPMQKADDKDYGLEALEEIMSVMDGGEVVVIFAGYREPMKRLISSNEGFCRRVTKFFYFDDFTPEDLAQIAHIKMSHQPRDGLFYGLSLHASCTVGAVARLIGRLTTAKQRAEMNGGLVDAMLANARENLDFRLDLDCVCAHELCTITLRDLQVGLELLSQS